MNICILGAGAFGLCLGIIANENKHNVTIWTKFEEEKDYIINNRKSPALPNIDIDKNINITTDFKKAIINSELVIIAIPASTIRNVITEYKEYIKDKHICIASKGIEQDTCLFISKVIKEIINTNKLCVISGPTFAIDVANKVPIGLSIASENTETINITENVLANKHVKLRETKDIIGVELCGSIKNVMAIIAGILDGLGLPISTQAMFITEATNDIKHLIEKLGGDSKTITSFAGFGDILLTCTSPKSRNFTFGKMLGLKKDKKEIENYIKNTTIEGLYTLDSIHKLITSKNIKMPIINLIFDIIYHDTPVEQILPFLIEK